MRTSLLLLGLLLPIIGLAQPINPEDITIARDEYGVPTVMGPTDRHVAYGLAWVQCEDQFTLVQQTLMLVKKRLGREYGRQGAAGDFFAALFQIDQQVAEKKDTDISPEFYAYASAFAEGLNAFAERYPREVLDKKLFPVSPDDLIAAYPLKIMDFIGATDAISRILYANTYDQEMQMPEFFMKGSNSFAFRSTMTKDGRTYLIANPHLAFSGAESFYEVGLISGEGWKFQGAMFPGSLSPQVGTNPHLGWTHTNNYFDHTDVFALKMHPTEPLMYEYNGEWRKLEERKIKLKVNVKWLPFNVGAKRKVYQSVYGPTLKSEAGNFFAIRTGPAFTIKTAEQWYRMAQATNLEAFKAALRMNGLPYFNITYADKADHILYIFNGLFPERTPGYDYEGLVPGHTSETNWDSFLPLDQRPTIENPDCGYVYNVNHTPYRCTCRDSWLDGDKYPAEVSIQENDNGRSYQWREIYTDGTPLSMAELKTLKYDSRLAEQSVLAKYVDRFQNLPEDTSEPALIQALREWDRVVDQDKVAPTYLALGIIKLGNLSAYDSLAHVPDSLFAKALTQTAVHLRKHFNTLDVPFSEFFRFRRGDKNLPIFGFFNTLAARLGGYLDKEDGRYYATGGDGFMMFIQYDESGVVDIESIVAYGASAEPDSPYYNNQMELFAAKKAKKMTLDRSQVLDQASKVYHPQ